MSLVSFVFIIIIVGQGVFHAQFLKMRFFVSLLSLFIIK
ncbi:hypothetical protein B4119_0859 [Parageobacillus caldoxylosilyticus]|uniref:Uncharacterized protein n=1 Tax=Saccharococcus caldoxylosilyticus TaxID=81408 RepID=A0A150LES0_9BACL|nr:hypothetical protein B4119_0859 [Parageobacillus caldoxylosilyticus]